MALHITSEWPCRPAKRDGTNSTYGTLTKRAFCSAFQDSADERDSKERNKERDQLLPKTAAGSELLGCVISGFDLAYINDVSVVLLAVMRRRHMSNIL